jgi:hypothetical protein
MICLRSFSDVGVRAFISIVRIAFYARLRSIRCMRFTCSLLVLVGFTVRLFFICIRIIALLVRLVGFIVFTVTW